MSNEIPQAVEEHFYRPFCSEDEIARIFNVRNADDYLLKARADYVADHVRHYRVMRRRMNVLGDKWSFSGQRTFKIFSESLFRLWILTLMFFAAFDAHAGDPVEIVLNDPWRSNPYTDASEVIEFERPYLLQFQVIGIAECARTAG